MPSEKDRKENTGAKPQHEPYGSRQAHAPQASRAYGRSEKDRNTSLVQNKDAQKEVLDFIIQSFYCSPKDSEELKTVIFIANDNSSKTPNADRWFIEGVFATLRHLTHNGGNNAGTLHHE